MKLINDIEELYYSIYRIQYSHVKNNRKLSKLILFFLDKFVWIELGTDEIDTPKVFCERYNQLYPTLSPSFNCRQWEVFVKMLFERAQVVNLK